MIKKLIICILIISLLSLLQSCCTMIGYHIGNNMDKKSEPEAYSPSTDSSMVYSDVIKTDSIKTSESNYTEIFATIGALADITMVVIFILLTNPIQYNLKF